jgi:hypothetical protein
MEFVYDEAQKKVAGDLWQDDTVAPQLMENAINEAVANVIYHTLTPVKIRELTE